MSFARTRDVDKRTAARNASNAGAGAGAGSGGGVASARRTGRGQSTTRSHNEASADATRHTRQHAAAAHPSSMTMVFSEHAPVGAFTRLDSAGAGRSGPGATQSVPEYVALLRRGGTPLLHGCAVVQSCVMAAAGQRAGGIGIGGGVRAGAGGRGAVDDALELGRLVEVHGSSPAVALVPYGPFDSTAAPSLPVLQAFLSTYLGGVPVAVQPPVPLQEVLTHSRSGLVGQVQLYTQELVEHVHKHRKRPSALCYMAVTMVDVYNRPDWNFAFSGGFPLRSTTVCSFARYDPSQLYAVSDSQASDKVEPLTPDERRLMLLRCMKVVSHEVLHLVGLAPCTEFECRLNCATSIRQLDAQPLHLCPKCLEKLHQATLMDPLWRYTRLRQLYLATGLEAQAEWVACRLQALGVRVEAEPEHASPIAHGRRGGATGADAGGGGGSGSKGTVLTGGTNPMLAAGAGARRAVTSMQDMAMARSQAKEEGQGSSDAAAAASEAARQHQRAPAHPEVPRLGLQGHADPTAMERQARYQAQRDAALAKLYGPHGPPRGQGGVAGGGASLRASASLPNLRGDVPHPHLHQHPHQHGHGHHPHAAGAGMSVATEPRAAFVDGGGSTTGKAMLGRSTPLSVREQARGMVGATASGPVGKPGDRQSMRAYGAMAGLHGHPGHPPLVHSASQPHMHASSQHGMHGSGAPPAHGDRLRAQEQMRADIQRRHGLGGSGYAGVGSSKRGAPNGQQRASTAMSEPGVDVKTTTGMQSDGPQHDEAAANALSFPPISAPRATTAATL